jgi:hypothetical protein
MPMPSYGKDTRVHVKKEVETVCEMQQKKNICLGNKIVLFLAKLKNRYWVSDICKGVAIAHSSQQKICKKNLDHPLKCNSNLSYCLIKKPVLTYGLQ